MSLNSGTNFNFIVCASEGVDKAQHSDQADKKKVKSEQYKTGVAQELKIDIKQVGSGQYAVECAWKFDIFLGRN